MSELTITEAVGCMALRASYSLKLTLMLLALAGLVSLLNSILNARDRRRRRCGR
jgi:hypothetical protein